MAPSHPTPAVALSTAVLVAAARPPRRHARTRHALAGVAVGALFPLLALAWVALAGTVQHGLGPVAWLAAAHRMPLQEEAAERLADATAEAAFEDALRR